MNLSIQLPEDLSSKIWRYVDLPKFLSLLEGASLYLARADRLGDPFEGSRNLMQEIRPRRGTVLLAAQLN